MYDKLIFCILVAYFYAVTINLVSSAPCLHLNYACSNSPNATKCCTGYFCDNVLDKRQYNGLSIGTYCCKHGSSNCTSDGECCSRKCYKGKCQACKRFHKRETVYQPCWSKNECCIGDCSRVYDQNQYNGTAPGKYCCKPAHGNDTRCIYNWECCATPKTIQKQQVWTPTSCQNGHCRPCTHLYRSCLNPVSSTKCCTGSCSNIYNSNTYNKLSTGKYCCLKGNITCIGNWQCCSQNCVKNERSIYGKCRDCKYLTQSCSVSSHCCVGVCTKSWPYSHRTPKRCCLSNQKKCKNHSECCSKRCGQINILGYGKCLPH